MTILLKSYEFPLGLGPVGSLWLSLLVAAVLSVALYRWALPKPISGIPFDKKAVNSILGNTIQILEFRKVNDDRFITWVAQHAQRNSWPLSQVWLTPLAKPTLILSDFREAQDIMLRRTKEFGRARLEVFANTTPEFHVALSSEDPKYKKNKALVKDLMSPSFLQNVSAPQVYAKSTYLIDLWKFKLEAAGDRPFNARDDIFSALSDMITGAAFALNEDMSTVKQRLYYLQSFDVNLQQNLGEYGDIVFPDITPLPYYNAFRILADHQGDQAKSLMPRLAHYYRMLADSTLSRAYKIVRDFEQTEIQKSIARLEADGNKGLTSALDFMVNREMEAATKEGRKPNFYQRRIFDEISGYYLAGHETTATTITWLVKYLAQSPVAQAKLRAILRETFTDAVNEGRQPIAQEIMGTNVPYLLAVMDEALRMRPPFSLLSREAMVDTVLLGHPVPKGTTVFMPSIGPSYHSPTLPIPEHMRSESSREKQWDKDWNPDDVHLFNPDRWLAVDEEKGKITHDAQAGPMQSFGLGPRQCFGKRLGYVQIRILITLLVWNFELQPLEEPLNSFDALEFSTAQPKYCYIQLKKAT